MGLYALLDEYHQSFVASRSASLYDSGVDLAGGLVALIGFAYLHRRQKGEARTKPVEL